MNSAQKMKSIAEQSTMTAMQRRRTEVVAQVLLLERIIADEAEKGAMTCIVTVMMFDETIAELKTAGFVVFPMNSRADGFNAAPRYKISWGES